MIKDVVVNLSLGLDYDPACEYAISLAHAFSAHLSAIAFAYDPNLAPMIVGGEMVMPPEWIDAQWAKATEAAKSATAKFEDGARRAGVSAEARVLNTGAANAADLFGPIARRFDLSVVRQSEPDKLPYEDPIIEAALFDSGRPVLVVPYIQAEGLKLDHVMVCWDGSRNAARAVGDAMPLLARAKAIEVLTIGTEIKSDEIPAADIAQHLARHGLRVQVENVAAPDLDVANTILSHAADTSANLIVMGGYGHSRLREFVLGGATRGILSTMTVPTLMSH
jgi:nucleotide-binding universal stress UspA family protein